MLPFQKKLSNSFYVLLSLPATAMGFGLSIQIAVLSWILHTQLGFDEHEVAIVWSAGPIAGILGQVIIGVISDNTWFWGGRRRPFIIIGGVLAALMIFLLPRIGFINQELGIGNLLAVAIVIALTLDLSINISFNPTRSIIADVTPAGRPRTKGYTWMQAISNLFGSMAYLIGALIDNYVLINVGVILILLFSIVPMFFIEEPRELSLESEDPEENVDQVVVNVKTQWSQLLKIYFAHAFTWLGVQTMFIFIIFFIKQKFNPENDDITGQIIGWSFFILNAVGFIFPILMLEPMAKRIGQVRTHFIAMVVMSLGYFGIAFFAKDTITLYILMVVLSFGWSSLVSLPFAIMTEKVDKNRMGFFMGIFNLSVVIPQLIVSYVVGYYIKEFEDKTLIFIISGISLGISALLWLLVKENKK